MAKQTDPNAGATPAPNDGDKPETKTKKKAPKLVKVRVAGNQPIFEGGELRQPARKVPDGKGKLVDAPADTFDVEEDRAEALGDLVQIVA
jgi:hypothetical protein